MSARKTLRFGFGLVVAGLFVWLFLSYVDGPEMAQVLADARPMWLALGVLAILVGYTVRVQRWVLMLRLDAPECDWRRAAGPFFVSMAANNVLPFRAGDVLRAVGFQRRLRVGTGSVVATLLVERLFDLLTVLLAFALVLFFYGSAGHALTSGAATLVLLAVGVAVVLLARPGWLNLIAGWVLGLVKPLAPALTERVGREVSGLTSTLERLATGGRLLRIAGLSLVAWSFEAAVFLCAAMALPAITAPLLAWTALPIATLATLIPSTPGYVGTFDVFAAEAMVQAGAPLAAAASFALVVHVLLWLPITLAGGLAALVMRFKPATDKKAALA